MSSRGSKGTLGSPWGPPVVVQGQLGEPLGTSCGRPGHLLVTLGPRGGVFGALKPKP